MGLTTPEEVAQFKTDTLDSLKKSQKDELNKFSKTLETDIVKLHQDAQNERDRIFFFGQLYKNKANKEMIDRLAARHGAQEPVSMALTEDGNAIFKGLTVPELKQIQTNSKNTITMGDDGTFSMSLSWFNFLPGYEGSAKADFINLAESIRACGHTQITMTVDYPLDPERAMELGRLQYEAAVKAGFDPNQKTDPKDPKAKISNIKIIVNGEEKTPDKLFEGQGNRLQLANQQFKNDSEKRKNYLNSPQGAPPDMSEMKRKVRAQRDSMEAQPEAEQVNNQVP
jgi:hypothetical protein